MFTVTIRLSLDLGLRLWYNLVGCEYTCRNLNVFCVRRSFAEQREWAGVPAAFPYAAAPVAGVEGSGRRRVGWRLPAGCGAGRQTPVASAAPPPASALLLSTDAAQGFDSRLGGGGGARPAGLPGGRRARHRHERRLHAAAAGAAALRGRQAYDGRASFKAARRCAIGLVPPRVEPAYRGIQRAIQCRRRRLLQLPGQRV